MFRRQRSIYTLLASSSPTQVVRSEHHPSVKLDAENGRAGHEGLSGGGVSETIIVLR
jgi:hypothetical protein